MPRRRLLIMFLALILLSACEKKELSPNNNNILIQEESKQISKSIEKRDPGENPLSVEMYGRDDPFKQSFDLTKVIQNEGLTGIVWDEENPIAIMDGEIVSVGDIVGENVVIQIKKQSVILSDGVKEFKIGLLE